MRVWPIAAGAVLALPGGVLLLVAARAWLRHRARVRFDAKSWPEQIAVLKTDRPLPLPPVRPLMVERESHRLLRFQERLRG